MSGFIDWLESLNQRDRKVRAVLRRSLSFEPGTYPAVYPYVEPFLVMDGNPWRRKIHYLVAGLWAQHLREGQGEGNPLGKAAALHMNEKQSRSTESRFVALLDSDEDQLPYRLRQMLALLKDESIDFESVLRGLLFWDSETRRTQIDWSKDFYRTLNHTNYTNEETP